MENITSSSTIIQNASTLVVSALVLAVLSLIWVWKSKLDRVKMMDHFPTPTKKHFLFGNTLDFDRDPSKFRNQILEWAKENEDKGCVCIWLGPFQPFLYMYTPQYAELLLSSSRQITKAFPYHFLYPWLGTGLLTSTGEKWKNRRRLITPTFHFKILNEFLEVFDEQSKILVSILKHHCNQGPLDIFPRITKCALDMICKTSMGVSVNAQKDGNILYANAVARISELVQERQKSPWLWPDFIYNLTESGKQHKQCLEILHGFTTKIIEEHINERKNKTQTQEETQVDEFTGKRKKRPVAFLDLLLDAYDDGKIDKEGIREEVDTFMFEGHDTTAAAMTWAVMLMGLHPDVQKRAQLEADNFFESRPENLTVDSVKDLKYLECVIKEALRLYPSVPFFARELVEDFVIDGVSIPKGVTIGVGTISLHANSNVWPDADKFDPDRFLQENSEGRHPYSYVPFSAGPRNCIGQRFALLEEKILLAYIIHHFDVKSEESVESIKVCAEIVTRPQDGIMVTLQPRINES